MSKILSNRWNILRLCVIIAFALSSCGGGAATSNPEETLPAETAEPMTHTFECPGTRSHYEVFDADTVVGFTCEPNDTFSVTINGQLVRGYIRLQAGLYITEGDQIVLEADVDIVRQNGDKLAETACKLLPDGDYVANPAQWLVKPRSEFDTYTAECVTSNSWSIQGTTSVVVKSTTTNVAPLQDAPYITWANQINGNPYLECVKKHDWDVWLYPSTLDVEALESGTQSHTAFGDALWINGETVKCIPVIVLNKDKHRVEYEGMVYTLDRRIVQGGYEWVPFENMLPGWNYYACEDGTLAYYVEETTDPDIVQHCIHGTYRGTKDGVSHFAVDGKDVALINLTGAFPSPQQ